MSGIYIPGMEMPKSCECCPCRTADAFGGLGCRATGYIPLRKANQDRPDWCPLIPVPEHGDLIDRDVARVVAWTEEEASGTFEDGALYAIDWMDAMPVIIPAEETCHNPAPEEVKTSNSEIKTSNADRIRAMTDYDLADWIAQILTYHGSYSRRPLTIDDHDCPRDCPLYRCCNDQPSDNIEDWLKSPADKEGEG